MRGGTPESLRGGRQGAGSGGRDQEVASELVVKGHERRVAPSAREGVEAAVDGPGVAQAGPAEAEVDALIALAVSSDVFAAERLVRSGRGGLELLTHGGVGRLSEEVGGHSYQQDDLWRALDGQGRIVRRTQLPPAGEDDAHPSSVAHPAPLQARGTGDGVFHHHARVIRRACGRCQLPVSDVESAVHL